MYIEHTFTITELVTSFFRVRFCFTGGDLKSTTEVRHEGGYRERLARHKFDGYSEDFNENCESLRSKRGVDSNERYYNMAQNY